MENGNEPQTTRRGWLKNNNPPGDLNSAPRCGAKTRKRTSCKAPAMANGKCRMHGGKSTGPRTQEGLEGSRKANWKHGYYSAESVALRRYTNWLLRESRAIIESVKGGKMDKFKGTIQIIGGKYDGI